ncbi:MAG: outer membrane beta-barrel protein [Candidatus Omnitrophica bacterium]|nr:outer membrane beta-barrel protein [Candidatus Omnitrophota bacterium]
MKLSKALVVLVAAVFLTASQAPATEWNGIRLTPYASISETYDDNVTYLSDDPIDDFITSVSLGLGAQYGTQLNTFDLTGTLRYEMFTDNDDFNNASGDVVAHWRQEISKYDRIRLREEYVRSDEPRSFVDAFNRSTGRFGYQTNDLLAEYTHDFNSRWSGSARYTNDFTIYLNDASNDSDMNGVGAEAIYHHSQETHFLFGYDFSTRDFEVEGSADDHLLSAGFRQYFTKQLYLDARAGVDFINTYDNEDMTEPMVEARLANDITERATVDIAFEKEHSLNPFVADIFDHWQISTSLRHELTKRLRSVAVLFYGDGDYVTRNRRDKFFGARAGLNYDLNKNWQVTFRYTFTTVESTEAVQEYEKNVVLLGLVLNF